MLPTQAKSLLSRAAHIAEEAGWPSYLVGGSVRDMLLGSPPTDLDISVVGDASVVAQRFASELGVELEVHERFGTSTVPALSGSYHLDFVTARRERYPEPGALPVTEPGTLADDLARRDFTINAMALPLYEHMEADLLSSIVDPHGGYTDLQLRHVAVLHERSFQDDPTRLFRAVRIAERLSFQISPNTLILMRRAVKESVLSTVSTQRMIRELLLCLEEQQAGRIMAVFQQTGILSEIHPKLHWPFAAEETLLTADTSISQRRDSYLALIAAGYAGNPDDAESLARALRLTARQVRLMRDAAQLAGYRDQLSAPDLRPSHLYRLLSPLDPSALNAFARTNQWSESTPAKGKLALYHRELAQISPHLTGNDLRQLGIPPGPIYRQILDELQAARLDGELDSRQAELDFVNAKHGYPKD